MDHQLSTMISFMTSYYLSNRCFIWKLSISDYSYYISYFIILKYVSHISRYIILSFVLCTLVLKINLVLTLSSLVIDSCLLEFLLHNYWSFPSLTSEIGTTEGSGGTAHKLRPKSYLALIHQR